MVLLAIHDGGRPLVSNDTIDRCFKVTAEKGNATAALPVVETIRKVDGEQNEPVDRSHFVGIQTPQTFRVSEIKEAYLQPYDPAFTDDSMVLERWGRKIFLVDGNRENIKITHLSDLVMAEALQRKEIDDKGKSNP
jgi:2-C-methyl-D-erythritol 4-phosphate cytidylyltransferase